MVSRPPSCCWGPWPQVRCSGRSDRDRGACRHSTDDPRRRAFPRFRSGCVPDPLRTPLRVRRGDRSARVGRWSTVASRRASHESRWVRGRSATPCQGSVGAWSISTARIPLSRRCAPAEWLAIVGPAAMDRGGIDGVTDPRWVTGLDGLEFADLGVISAEDDGFPYLPSISGVPAEGCQRRAIGIGPDVVVEIAILPSKDLDAVISQIQLGTLEDLEATGAERLPGSLVPPTCVQRSSPRPIRRSATPGRRCWRSIVPTARRGCSGPRQLGQRLDTAAAVVGSPGLRTDIRTLIETGATAS